ncbi:hypothetical protein E2C01_096196 [Portunus trituberculatus]|uniref:Uncharacterized protein n=1 Tax=Portunus trituberculatus TaxID=210409 RepID=A0A5B7JXC0_PORTR|nr:hypothetical protein [Portunus trituberculatus]
MFDTPNLSISVDSSENDFLPKIEVFQWRLMQRCQGGSVQLQKLLMSPMDRISDVRIVKQ